jgi:hypothetical protein
VLCNSVLYLLKLVKGITCTIVTHLKSLSCLSVYLKSLEILIGNLKNQYDMGERTEHECCDRLHLCLYIAYSQWEVDVEGRKMGDFLTVGYSWLWKTYFQKWFLLSIAVVIWLLVGTFKENETNVEKCVKLNGTHCSQTFTHQVIRIQVEIYSTVANLMWLCFFFAIFVGFLYIWVAYFWSNSSWFHNNITAVAKAKTTFFSGCMQWHVLMTHFSHNWKRLWSQGCDSCI